MESENRLLITDEHDWSYVYPDKKKTLLLIGDCFDGIKVEASLEGLIIVDIGSLEVDATVREMRLLRIAVGKVFCQPKNGESIFEIEDNT